jgi:hypothetical protein
MTIEHSLLNGSQLHESKGLSAASDKDYNLAVSGANSWETLVGVQTDTASSYSEIDFVDLSAYNILVVTFQDLLPAASSFPLLRVSTDNGSSFLNTDIYYTGFNQDGTNSFSVDFGNLYLSNSASTNYLTGKIVISAFNQEAPSSVNGHVATTGGSNFTTSVASKAIKGFINSATAFNAIRVFQSTGNITSGTITVEGIKG